MRNRNSGNSRPPPALGRSGPGFTLIDLLVSISVIALLAAMLLPALARAKSAARTAFCLNNKKELALAWILYAQDDRDFFAYNSDMVGSGDLTPSWQPHAPNWVFGDPNWTTDPWNTNEEALIGPTNASLAPYLSYSARPFHCPEDTFLSAPQRALGWSSRIRSASMNYWLGDGISLGGSPKSHAAPFAFLRFEDLVTLTPSMAFVFIDEHPDSMVLSPSFDQRDPVDWYQLPASYHSGGCTLSFADGHAEYKEWLVAATRCPVTYTWDGPPTYVGPAVTADLRDWDWLWQRAFGSGPPNP